MSKSLPDLYFPLPFLDSLTRKSGIRRILIIILAFSLLPLVALATWNGIARQRLDAQMQLQQLHEAAALTATSELNVIKSAEGLLNLLTTNENVRSGNQERCKAAFSAAIASFPAYTHFALIGPDGKVVCSNHEAAIGTDARKTKFWSDRPSGEFSVSNPLWGEFSRRQVLWAMQPIFAPDGSFTGAITASIDLAWLQRLLGTYQTSSDTLVLLVDGNGRVIASSRPVTRSTVPISDATGRTHTLIDASGAAWNYVTAPLHVSAAASPDGSASYHIVYASPRATRFSPEWWIIISTFAFPALALVLASFAIWIGANRAILRWIGELGQLAQDIGEGHYRSRTASFAGAPLEIRGLAADLHRMSRTIAERDRSLMETLAHQRALTFELHHRVRNNLQIISSYIRLHTDRKSDIAASASLYHLRLRVGALSMVHRLLFDSGDRATISTRDLIEPLALLIHDEIAALHPFETVREIEEHPLSIDSAVPLSLWLVEAADLLARRGSDGTTGELRFTLTVGDDGMTISVEASGLGPVGTSGQADDRLLRNMSRQMGGRLEQVEPGETSSAITLHITPRMRAAPPGKSNMDSVSEESTADRVGRLCYETVNS